MENIFYCSFIYTVNSPTLCFCKICNNNNNNNDDNKCTCIFIFICNTSNQSFKGGNSIN